MKTILLPLLSIGALSITAGLHAQSSGNVGSANTTAMVSASQTIYLQALPSAQQLSDAAAAQHIAIDRIDQTAGQMVVTYRFSNGQLKVVAYQALAPGAGVAVNTPPPSAVAPVVVTDAPPRAYYYDDYPYYGSYYGYPRVSVGVGFGFRGGFHHGWR